MGRSMEVFLSRTASEHGEQTDKSGTKRVFSRILIGGPGTACTETYLVVGRYSSETEALNLGAYLHTKFVRFLVSRYARAPRTSTASALL
jgi:site-specific DNA-methyltransferase (adenine-specific)